MVDHRPAVIARCASASDVASAVRFGRARGLDIGVRGGGHGIVGRAVPHGGLLIDLSLLSVVRVDPDRAPGPRPGWGAPRRLRCGGSIVRSGHDGRQRVAHRRWRIDARWRHGLAGRLHGLTCDNVISFEVVCASGEVAHASASENAELFWGLRGGGGNFGVVTDFEFSLHPVSTPPSWSTSSFSRSMPRGRCACGAISSRMGLCRRPTQRGSEPWCLAISGSGASQQTPGRVVPARATIRRCDGALFQRRVCEQSR